MGSKEKVEFSPVEVEVSDVQKHRTLTGTEAKQCGARERRPGSWRSQEPGSEF